MSMARDFDGLSMPLDGIHLIEASAGTGKTYSLAGLYLRLLIEKRLDVSQILVMTFTRAATRELRERIRLRLCQAAEQAHAPQATTALDNEMQFSEALFQASDESRLGIAQRLRDAANRMDEAAILTIHGFSQRAAQDNAFHSGLPFDRGDTVDDGDVLYEVGHDYWRQIALSAGGAGFRQLWATPQDLLDALKVFSLSPHLQIAGPSALDIKRMLEELLALWSAQAATLQENLEQAESQGALRASGSDSKLKAALDAAGGAAAAIAQLDAYLSSNSPCLPDWLSLLSSATKQFKKKAEPQAQALQALPLVVSLCRMQPLLQAHALQRAHLVTLAMATKRKRERRQYSFADMIGLLHEAIQGENGQALADSLYNVWPWALVDEFQDTDPVQYAILKRCYSGRDQGGMILIGDPKQAIYGFRGGDVHAYLSAAQDAGDQRYGLKQNFRSSPAYLDAVETVFTQSGDGAFLLQGIEFEKVTAGRSDHAELLLRGDAQAAMNILQHPAGDKALGKGVAENLCLDACISQMRDLLAPSNKAQLRKTDGTKRSLQARDIAVLVNTNRQASEVQQALAATGIAAVCVHQQSVFASAQASDLLLVLLAIASPNDERRLRGALSSELFAYPLARLLALEQDEAAWQLEVEGFQQAHETWRKNGILALVVALVQQASLHRFADADRRLSNYLQIGELLAEMERDNFAMNGLIADLQQAVHKAKNSKASEAEQLRLESDEALVRVVTVHKAKGLEYPIVFLPFLPWLGAAGSPDLTPYRYHANGQSMLDFSPSSEAAQQAIIENRAEALRVLYVALTRAELACYWPWGFFAASQNSAMASLLHREHIAPNQWYASTKADPLSAELIQNDLQQLQSRAPHAVAMQPWPAERANEIANVNNPLAHAQARTDLPQRRLPWQFHSFSSLLRHSQDSSGPALSGAGDEDYAETLDLTEVPQDLPDLPGGPVFGDVVHQLLEQLEQPWWENIDPHLPALQQRTKDTLRQFGIALSEDEEAAQQVVQDTAQLLAHTLTSPIAGVGRLAQRPASARKAEMEFHFKIAGTDFSALLKLLQAHGYAQGMSLEDAPTRLRGLMHGYIDLVVEHEQAFYVIDYKTNWLGTAFKDYAAPRLVAAIQHHHYDVQYLIYLTALHRYLQWRHPHYAIDQHLGGARYLFLRGMNPEHPNHGVHCDRPSSELILALDQLFASELPA